MSDNNEEIGDNRKYLLDELQTLLEKQVEMARQGNIRDVEVLCEQAGSVVEKIVQTQILDPAESIFNRKRREQLQKLYEDLCLAITDQKAEVSKELNRVRKGKKTIQTYRNHI